MSTTLLVAALTFFGTVTAAVITGWFLLRAKTRELATTTPIAAWEQWREDNTSLRQQITELRNEIVRLESKIDDLGESKAKIQEERDIARRERDEWRERCEREHAVANIFAQLYDFALAGRVPDTVMLETMNRELRDVGFLSLPTPATGPVHKPL